MSDFRDRAIDNALEERLGARRAPDLSARILQAARDKDLFDSAPAQAPLQPTRRNTGRRYPTPKRRPNYALAIEGTASLLAVFVAIGLLVFLAQMEKPASVKDTSATGTTNINKPAPQPNTPQPSPKEEHKPRDVKPAPEVTPKPPEEKPPAERPVEPPKQPEPEKPVETPRKPDEVEKPVETPKEPEKTEPKPVEKRAVASLLAAPKQAKLRVRYDAAEPWRDPGSEVLEEGVILQCAAPVDVQLADSTLLRLDGEVQLGAGVTLLRGTLYADNLGKDTLTIAGKRVSATLRGAAVFELSGDNLEIACLEGRITCGEKELAAGNAGVLRMSGLGSIKPLAASRTRDAFLKGLPVRTLLRADFAEKPAGLLREGEIAEGVASGPRIFWSFGHNQQVLPGSVMRLRIRVTGAEKINFSLFAPKRDDNFGHDGVAVKPGEWVELEIELSAFKDRRTHKQPMAAGEEFMNVQIWTDIEGAKLELDWIEFARRPAK